MKGRAGSSFLEVTADDGGDGLCRTRRRRVLRTLALCSLAALLPGCSAETRRLTVAVGVWQGYETLFLARRRGWLDPRQVRLGEVPSNSASLRALVSGIEDGAALTLDEVLRARADGLELGIVLVFDLSAGADMLLARPDVDGLPKLKGKRIGLAQQTYASVLLAAALGQAGLAPSDVQRVELVVGDQIAAWEQHRVDAVVTYQPVAGRLQERGARLLFDSRAIPGTIVDVLAVRAEVLADPAYDPAIRELIAAHFRALEFLHRQPGEASRLMAGHLGMPAEQALAAFEGMSLPGLAENRRLLGGRFPLLLGSAEAVVRFMREGGMLPGPLDLRGLLSDRFLPSSPDP